MCKSNEQHWWLGSVRCDNNWWSYMNKQNYKNSKISCLFLTFSAIIPGVYLHQCCISNSYTITVKLQTLLTHWGQNKMAAIYQTTFSNPFFWIKMFEYWLRFHWSLFLRVQLAIMVQIMAWRRPGDKPLSEPMMVTLLTHICLTRPQWINSSITKLSVFNWLFSYLDITIDQ